MSTREPERAGDPARHSTTGFLAPAPRRGTIVVAFADPPGPATLARLPGEVVEIISDSPPESASPWRPLAPFRRSVPVDVTLDLLRRLNSLVGREGTPYSDRVREGELRPWWFHQQIAFDHYLEPFLAYRPLIEAWASAERVVILDPPDDLASLLPLLPIETISAISARDAGRRPTPIDGPDARRAAASVRTNDDGTPSVENADRIRTTGGGRVRRAAKARGLAAALYFGLMSSVGIAISLAKRRDLIVFGVDVSDDAGRNPWLSGLYDAMARQGYRFDELVWSRSGMHAVRQAARRRRPVIHLQAVVPRPPAAPTRRVTSCVPTDDLTTAFLHALAERVLAPRAHWSVRAIHRIERLLDILRPAGVLVMDDPVHSFEVLAACRRRSIPTVAVQHGQIGRHTAGLIAPGYTGPPLFADRYCVWSDRFRRLLASESSLVAADSIRVCGLPRAAEVTPPTRKAGESVSWHASGPAMTLRPGPEVKQRSAVAGATMSGVDETDSLVSIEVTREPGVSGEPEGAGALVPAGRAGDTGGAEDPDGAADPEYPVDPVDPEDPEDPEDLDELEDLEDLEDLVVPVGPGQVDGTIRGRSYSASSRANLDGDTLRVLFLAEQFESYALEREVAPYLRALWRSFPEMRIRPHPVRPSAGELLRLLKTDEPPIGAGERDGGGSANRRHGGPPALAADSLGLELARTDVVVGSFSSALFEAIHALVPVVLFSTPRHNDPHDLAADGLAALATSPAAIARLVRAAARLPRRERQRRRNELWGPLSRDGGRAVLAELARLGAGDGLGMDADD